MDVALWDQQAEAFEAEKYMSMAEKQPVVLLFVAVTARLYQGTRYANTHTRIHMAIIVRLHGPLTIPFFPPHLLCAQTIYPFRDRPYAGFMSILSFLRPLLSKIGTPQRP